MMHLQEEEETINKEGNYTKNFFSVLKINEDLKIV